MKKWEISETEHQEIIDLNLGWKIGHSLPLNTLALEKHKMTLLSPFEGHIFRDSDGKSIVIVLNGRGVGRDLLRSIGEAQLLIATLNEHANGHPVRLIRVFSTPESADGELWLRIFGEVSPKPIECLLRFDDTFMFWKSGMTEPLRIPREPKYRNIPSCLEGKRPSTYQNLFGPQSSRILQYYILAGQTFENVGTLEIPRSINHLSTLVGIPQSSVSRTFAALEEQGFIYRKKEKRSLIPQIIAGRRLLEAWWENERKKVLSGNANLTYFIDPSPLADNERQAYLEKDVLTFLTHESQESPQPPPQFALGGQMALRLLGLSVSNEESCVVHLHNDISFRLITDRLGLIPCASMEKGTLVLHSGRTPNQPFLALRRAPKHKVWTVDPLTFFLDTVFAPQRAAEQREFLLDKVFVHLFEMRGWRL